MPDPTNPLATATPLAVGNTGTHTLNTATLNDYYRFTLGGRSSLNLSLTGLDGNADLQLLLASGVVLQQSTNTGMTADDINYTDLGAGVYYLRVLAASGTTSAHYTLSLQATQNTTVDLLWRNYSTGANALWTMQDTTRVSSVYLQSVGDPNWKLEGSADFTGDGRAELVWRNYSTGQNVLWQMNGTTAATSLALPTLTDTHWHIVSVDDFNGDAQADLIWRNDSTGQNLVWQMQGTTLVSTLALPTIGDLNWQIGGSGDFNRDGQTDLVWRNYSTGQDVVWYMQGTTLVESVDLNPIGDLNWRIEGVADFNGDQRPDLVWRNYATGENAIWHMQGTTRVEGVYFNQIGDLNWQMAAAALRYGVPGDVHVAGPSTATAFDLGTLNGQATYQSTLNSSGNDYYRFTLSAANPNVYARVTASHLDLLSSSGSVLQSAATGGIARLQSALGSGTYYLRVSGANGYTLVVADTSAPPTVTASLVNDTARSGLAPDQRTADPTVSVQVGSEHWLGSLTAGFNTTAPTNFLALGALLGNRFTLTPTQLQAINGNQPLTEGVYVLHLRATGVDDVTATTTDFTFTLDTTTVAPSGLHLTTGTGNTTNVTTPTVTGQAEVGALVKVYGAGNVLLGQGVADSTGTWQAPLSPLTDGTYNVTAIATDVAGNVSTAAALTISIATNPVTLADTFTLQEGNNFLTQISKSIALGQTQGTRKLSFDLSAQFGTAPSAGALEDDFLVYLVDTTNHTLLDQGKGTAVFSLSGSKAEFTPGLVTYNGTTVTLDLSSLKDQTSGTLIFQLFNNDTDTTAAVQVQHITSTVDPTGVSSPTLAAATTVLPGAAIGNVSSYTTTTTLKPILSNIHRNPTTGKFVANLQVQNTGTTAVGRQLIASFANLPVGVTLVNASGTDANGKPYLNLKPAIANGGLAAGALSDAVEITFDDPNLVSFNWQPTFLSGPANQAPVLNQIAPLSLHPGEYQAIPLATDPDGDFVTLTIRSQGAPPPVSLSGDGKLILNPSPAQVGNYAFTIVASDGVLETTQSVQLTVAADPETTTRLSGVLKSAGSTPQALAGITVKWGSEIAITRDDGSFTLSLTGDIPTTPLKIIDARQKTSTDPSYSDVTLNVNDLLGHTPYAQVNNVFNQTLYLTALDTTNATTISGSGATTVSNPNGAALTVPAGVLKNAQGNPYTGQASLTPLDSAQLVAPLPDGVSGNGLIQVDLKDAVCTGSLPLQIRNPTAYRGAVDLYGQLPNGSFGIIGSGYAGADGYFTSTPYTHPDPANPNNPITTNGVPGSGIYFFAPKALAPKGLSAIDRNPDEVCESCKVRKRLNEDATVELHSGGVMESHELPTYESLGATRGIQLQYDSLRADPRPIVHFGYDDVQYDPADNSKYRMIAKLTVKLDNGTTYQVPGYQGHDYGLTGGENFWLLPLTASANTSIDVDGALQVDLRNQTSGLYDYDLTTGIKVLCDCVTNQHFYGASTTQKDQLVVVNSINSAFGSGWGLAGWQELVESTSGSVLLIDGNGSQLVFKKVGSSYQSPDGDFSTLYKLADGTFQRVAKDGTLSTFNAQKKLQSVVDRNGLTTTYTYDTSGRLSSMIDPAGDPVKTTFTYYDTGVNANRVHFITDPAGRITTLAYDASGNLIQVTDPDSKAQVWGYDDQHHLASTTDKLGTQTAGQSGHTDQTFYDFAGRATKAIDKDGSVVQVKPVQVQGLHKAEETVDPFKAPVAFTSQPVESDYVDAKGNVTRVFLDRAQQELFSQDGLGDSAKSERNDPSFGHKYLVTKTTDARGNATSYTYDNKGNVIQIVAPLSQGTLTTNSLFPEPTTTITPQVVAVDWDSNGTLDLVSAAGTIAFGDGHGGFSAPVTTTVTPGRYVAVGDLNQDGRLDIVTSSTVSANGVSTDVLHLHLQQANGTFGAAIDRAIAGTKSEIVAIGLADLDGDNDLDLFSLNGVGYNIDRTKDVPSDNNLAIWLNNGQAGFATTPTKTTLGSDPMATPLKNRPTALTTGDLNHDGRLDAVVSDGTNVSVLLGQSNGTFTVNTTYAGGNQAQAALADVNGDGQLDLMMLSGKNVLVRLGLAAPGSGALFSATATTVATAGFTPSALFLQDLDGDSKLDLLVTQASSSANVESYKGLGNGTFATVQPYTLPNGYDQFLIGDFNTKSEDPTKAGTLDVLSLSGTTTAAPLLLNQGDGTFVARALATGTNYPLAHTPTALLTADVNGDGNADIILSDTNAVSANKVAVRLGNGDGTFAPGSEYTVGSNPSAIAVGDVDKDGTLDLIIANRSDGTASVLKGLKQNGVSTGTFGAKTDYAVGNNPSAVAVGDFNQDGNLDIVSANAGDGTVSVLWGSATGAFGNRTSYTVGSTPSAIALADLNGDTRLDLVTANTGSNTVSVLLNNGTASTFNTAVSYTTGSSPKALAIGDVTQDGKLDLVVANVNSDSVSVLAGVGNGTFGGKQDYTVGSSPQSVALGDVNGDSRLDILTANASNAGVSVLLGGATGLFATTDRFDFQPNTAARAIALADFNRDGALDYVTVGGDYSAPILSPRLNDRLQIGAPIGTGHHDYVYDQTFNQLTRETDELGRVTTYALDEHGNVSRMTRVVGTEDSLTQLVDDVVTTYTYTTDGRVTTINDPKGHVTEYNYDYDSATNRYRNLRQITLAKGTADEATQTFEYDAAGNQAAVIDERGNRTEYHYDLNTNWLTEMVQADPDGAGPLTAPRTQYTYDANGRQLTVKDARGVAQGYVTQTNEYDALGRLVKTTSADPDGSGPLLAPVTTYTYDLNGNLASMVDALGHETKYHYDVRNRLIETIHPDLTVTQQRYDADNNSIGSVDTKGQKTQTILDARGRRVAEFDALGNQTRFVYDVANQLVAQIDAKGQVTRFVYDDLGRQVQVIDALGQVSKTTYDQNGNVVAQTDALNHQTQYGYDNRDRQTTVTDALNHITTTTYDKVGNVLTIKDPDLNTTTYTYDGLNRLLTDTNQLGAARTYGYDANGNQTSVTDRNNQTRTFTYDRLNRQTQENWLNGSGNSLRAITSTYNVGSQLTELQDPDSDYHYTYDLSGRLKTIDNQGTSGVARVVLTYDYESNGNLKSVVDTINGQAGGTTTYTFDPLDRVSQINQTGTGVQSKQVNFTYNALGQMATIDRYAGSTNSAPLVAGTTYTYDGLNRLQQLSHKKVDGGTIASYTYGYDAASRITSLGSQFANAAYNDNSTYSYDNTNQLAGADHSVIGDEGYTYDANGNRTNAGYQTATNNQLSSDGTYNYTYDAEGNLRTRTEIATGKVREFTWDYRNRLTGVTDKTGGTVAQQVSYTYDVADRRITKAINGAVTHFIYDQENVILEFNGENTINSHVRYLYGLGIDEILAQDLNGATDWLLTDRLGSVTDLIGNDGITKNHYTYDSFGNRSAANTTTNTRYGYTGREWDTEIEMYYYRMRYYDPKMGRFISQDPLAFDGGSVNIYNYVSNNPFSLTDPSGMSGQVVDGPYREIEYGLRGKPKMPQATTMKTVEQFLNRLRTKIKSPPVVIYRDETTATLQKGLGGIRGTSDPYGGLKSGDQRGHIVPRELGGGTNRNNMFSQNKLSNNIAYKFYAATVASELRINGEYGSDNCCRVFPYMQYTVNMHYEQNIIRQSPQLISFPLRPTSFDAKATMKFTNFDYPASFRNPA